MRKINLYPWDLSILEEILHLNFFPQWHVVNIPFNTVTIKLSLNLEFCQL